MSTLIVERSSDNATKEFSFAEVKSGEITDWVTENQSRADGWAVLINQGSVSSTPSTPTAEKPKIVKNGVLVDNFARGILELDGSDDGYEVSIPSKPSITVAVRANPRGSGRQTLIDADGLLVYVDGNGTVKALITDGTTTPIVTLSRHKGVINVVAAADDSTLVLRVGGESASTTHSITRNQSGTATIGKENDGSNPIDGDLSDAFAWGRFFTASERTDVWKNRLMRYRPILQPWQEEDLTSIERGRVMGLEEFIEEMPVQWDFDLDFREGVVPQKVKDNHTRTSKAMVLGVDGDWKEVNASVVPIHHDPVTGERMAWFEKESTNLIDAGRDLSAGGWIESFGTFDYTRVTGINGNSGATKIEDTDTNEISRLDFFSNVPDDENGVTAIFFLKKKSNPDVLPRLALNLSSGDVLKNSVIIHPETGEYRKDIYDGAEKVLSTPGWWWVILTLNNTGNGNTNVTTRIEPAFESSLNAGVDSSLTGEVTLDAITTIRHGPAGDDGSGQAGAVYRAHPIFTGPPDYSVGQRTRAADEIGGMPVDWPSAVTSGGLFHGSEYAAENFHDGGKVPNAELNLYEGTPWSGLLNYNRGVNNEKEGELRISLNTDEGFKQSRPENIEHLDILPDKDAGVKGASFGVRRIAAKPSPLTDAEKTRIENQPPLLRNLEVFVDYPREWNPGDPLPNRVRGTWADEFEDVNGVQASTNNPLFGSQSGQYNANNNESHEAQSEFLQRPSSEDFYFAAWVTPSDTSDRFYVSRAQAAGFSLGQFSGNFGVRVHRISTTNNGYTTSTSVPTDQLSFFEAWVENGTDLSMRVNGGAVETKSVTFKSIIKPGGPLRIGAASFDGALHNAVVEIADRDKGESLQWPSANAYNGGNGLTWNDVLNS
jgi:hypothetical protein